MSVMLGDKAVELVVVYLNDNLECCCDNKPLHAYKYEKPVGMKGEYICVNHLPFIHRDVVGEGIVNINVHVPKTKTDLPDTKRLSVIVQDVVRLFGQRIYLEKAFFEFFSDSRPVADEDGTYYVNIQLNVIFNNLNYN